MAPLKGELSAQLTEGSSQGSVIGQRALMPLAELARQRLRERNKRALMAHLKGELSAQLTEGSSHASALAQRALMPLAELSSSRMTEGWSFAPICFYILPYIDPSVKTCGFATSPFRGGFKMRQLCRCSSTATTPERGRLSPAGRDVGAADTISPLSTLYSLLCTL